LLPTLAAALTTVSTAFSVLYAHANMHTHMHMHTRTHTHTRITHAHATNMHIYMYSHTSKEIDTRHIQKNTYGQRLGQAHTSIHKHTHTHTHAHTSTHTHVTHVSRLLSTELPTLWQKQHSRFSVM